MSFTISPILSRYIGMRFFKIFLAIFAGLLGLIFLIDAIEMIRILAKHNNLTLSRTIIMTALKLPKVGLDLMPFAVLIAAVFTFWRLTRTSELVVVRATGVSAWQFMLAPLMIGILLALVKMALLNPIGSAMLTRYEQLDARYTSYNQNIVNVAKSGLWLRQKINDNEIAIIHADNIHLPEWIISPAIAFFFDQSNHTQTYRIDAKNARLIKDEWVFNDAWVNDIAPLIQQAKNTENTLQSDTNENVAESATVPDHEPKFYKTLRLPTKITSQDIISRFTSPETISFWQLPEYARIMKSTGFQSNPLWAHFYGLLAEPFLNAALIIIAAALALRAPRMQRNWWLVIGTLSVGFLIFFIGDLLEALGISDKLPLFVAAFVPATLSLFIGLTALLYLEDG